jgi:hypothetical protein
LHYIADHVDLQENLMTHHQCDPRAGAPAAIVRRASGRFIGALIGVSVFIIVLAATSSHPVAVLAQTGDGNADTDNNGVNAGIAELQSTVADLQSVLDETQSDLVDAQAELLGAQSDLAKALLAIDELRAAHQQTVVALTGLAATLQHVRVDHGEINGLAGPHLIIEGCNVHVRSGSGATDD